MSDSRLGSAYREATATCPLGGDGCPTADELAAAARGRLAEHRREALVAILANCSRCAIAVQMATDLATPGSAPGVAAPRRVRRWLPMSLAAVLVVALVPMIANVDGWLHAPDRITRGADPAVQPAPRARLQSPPAMLSWPAADGSSCSVVLRNAAADVLLRSPTVAGGRFALEPALREQLADGEFLWTVDCGDRQLGPYDFVVRQ